LSLFYGFLHNCTDFVTESSRLVFAHGDMMTVE